MDVMSDDETKFGPFALIQSPYNDERRTLRIGSIKMWWPWPLARGLHGSSAMVLGYPVYGDSPRWVGFVAHKILRPASDGIYWLKYRLHPRHKYHLVDTKLGPGYYDQDTRMLHACFSLLGDYIEEEGGIEAIRSNGETIHVIDGEKQAEIVALWDWWKVEKPADEAKRDAMMSELFGGQKLETKPVEGNDNLVEWVEPEHSPEWEARWEIYQALDKKIDDDEQAMLHRLINLRPGLWT